MAASSFEISNSGGDEEETVPILLPDGTPARAKIIEESSWSRKWIAFLLMAVLLYITLDTADIGPWKIGTKDYQTVKREGCHETDLSDTSPIKENEEYSPIYDVSNNDFWPIIPDEHWSCMPRPFLPWNATHREKSWCLNNVSDYPKNGIMAAGLILVKVHKAASSTLAGINLRIAHHYGNCLSYQHHEDSRVYHKRDLTNTFMYSSIRHPVHRAISWIFYKSSNQGITVSERFLLKALKSRDFFVNGARDPSSRNFNDAGAQAGYMHTGQHLPEPLWQSESPTVVQSISIAITRVEQVMDQYNFIAVVERLSESLVVLQLLLGLKTTDILYLSAKRSGGWSYNFAPNRGCHQLKKSFIPPEVQDYFQSSEWLAQNYQDYLLYKTVNASLDLTIEALGRERFQQALQKYQEQMLKVNEECEAEAIFPCSEEGVHNEVTNCYFADWGCGYPCLDRKFDI